MCARGRPLVCLDASVLVHSIAWAGSVFERLAGACEGPAHGLSSGELCLSDVTAVFEVGALNAIAVDDLGVA